MIGMLQIITYLLAVYLVVKGLEVLQIAFASNREKRTGIIMLGILVLAGCVVAAIAFATLQDNLATSISSSVSRLR
jgi:uncharacterized membrane protein